jgi:hypothetical protein
MMMLDACCSRPETLKAHNKIYAYPESYLLLGGGGLAGGGGL